MHKVASNTALNLNSASPSRRKPAVWAVAALVGVLTIAWVDGGEEPIHAISQPVELPVGVSE
ncbi:MAG: hypothetical protein HRT64_09555 [Erythrobacter sp.]|nr:hypothetical protein [Erythrobacter sp.]